MKVERRVAVTQVLRAAGSDKSDDRKGLVEHKRQRHLDRAVAFGGAELPCCANDCLGPAILPPQREYLTDVLVLVCGAKYAAPRAR